MINFPLETERLLLRPIRLKDADDLHQVYGDSLVMQCIPGGPACSLDDTRERLRRLIRHQEEHGFSLWAVEEKASRTVVGDCGLILAAGRGRAVELAYRLARRSWGKGYATEAARACIQAGLQQLRLAQIIAVTEPGHVASRRVLEKAGLVYEGTGEYYHRFLVVYVIRAKYAAAAVVPTGR